MIRGAIRVVTAVIGLTIVLFGVGIGILWFNGARVVERAEARGWFASEPPDSPMSTFESTAAKAMFGPTWNEKGFPCRTASRFWLHYTRAPDKRGLSISQVMARDISYEIEANQSIGSQTRQLSVACILEGRLNDTQLLRLWLRRASFGQGVVGLDAASEKIFNKASTLLNAEESARLIALIYQPGLQDQRDKWREEADLVARRASAD